MAVSKHDLTCTRVQKSMQLTFAASDNNPKHTTEHMCVTGTIALQTIITNTAGGHKYNLVAEPGLRHSGQRVRVAAQCMCVFA